VRAAVFHGRGDLRLEELPEPEPGPGEVKLRVRFAGICGTDLHELDHGPIFTPGDRAHPLTGVTNPVILGHELAGEVVAAGEGVDDLAPGTLVAVDPIEACETCAFCRAGTPTLCPRRAAHGLSRAGGAFSEHTVVKRSMAHAIPAGVEPRAAAVVEPLSVGLHAVRRARLAAGDSALVLGLGPIGIAVALGLRTLGVEPIVSDPSPRRREAARALRLPHVLDPGRDDVVATVRELTDGRGVDAAFDAAGVPASLDTALDAVAGGGAVVLVAVPLEPVRIAVPRLRRAEATLVASGGALSHEFDDVIALVAAGAYELEPWTTTIAFDEIPRGFEALRRQEQVKVLVDVAGTIGTTGAG